MGAVEGLLMLLGGVAPLLGAASWHTLHHFRTAVWERDGQMPHYTCLMYVDDHLVGRYDKHTRQCVPQSSWIEEIRRDDTNFWTWSTGWGFGLNLVTDLLILKNLYNQSKAIHTLQAFAGCEVSGEGGTPQGSVRYGYNGRDFLSLNLVMLTWTALSAEAKPIKKKWDAERDRGKLWGHFLATCPDRLRTHLHYGKEALQRIDPPEVSMARKAGSDGLETLVCQLHGFYPKEIDVTWWKDGEDQKPHTFMGAVVPNWDRTYHTWLSITVDPEERGHYRCHVEHDGLPEPLDLAWEEPASESKVGLIVGAVLWLVAALALVGAGVTYYIKEQRGGTNQGTPTPESKLGLTVVVLEVVASLALLGVAVTFYISSGSEMVLTVLAVLGVVAALAHLAVRVTYITPESKVWLTVEPILVSMANLALLGVKVISYINPESKVVLTWVAVLEVVAALVLLGIIINLLKEQRGGSYQGAPTSDQGSESSASASDRSSESSASA